MTRSRLASGQRLSTVLEADSHQKMLMKFVVNEKGSNKPVRIHQAFVIFVHKDTKQEMIFVSEADASNNYKFDVVGVTGFFKIFLV